jgi:uncharacterized protein (TIGR03435 family)
VATPLHFLKKLPMRGRFLAVSIAAMSSVGYAQEAQPFDAPQLKFEAVVIKPSDPTATDGGMQGKPHGWKARDQTVFSMMVYAFDAHSLQFAEVPRWAYEEHFDIDAVPDMQTPPTRDQFHEMVRSLLIERFGLKLTKSTRTMPAYAIRLDKSGSKLVRSEAAATVQPSWNYVGEGHVRATDLPMSGMVRILQWNATDRPLVDQTGLTGRFNWELRWRPDSLETDAANSDLPDFFTATREQLGLKLERTNAPVTVWVVEKVTRPTQN